MKRVIIFIFFFILIFENLNCKDISAAEDKIDEGHIGITNDVLTSFKSELATSPECTIDLSDLLVYGLELTGGITAIVSGTGMINAGLVKIASSFPPTVILGGAMVTLGGLTASLGSAALWKLIFDAGGHTLCYLSFVRDPVLRYPNFLPADHKDKGKVEGKFKGIDYQSFDVDNNLKPGASMFKPVSNRWEALPDSSSDEITVCMRDPFPVGIFSFKGCNGVNRSGGWMGRIFDSDTFSGKHKDYDGKNSLLCPEEYRQIGRKAKTVKMPWETKQLMCTKFDGVDCPAGSLGYFKKQFDYLKDFKLTFGGPSCKTATFLESDKKKTVNINGYTYTLKAKGNKLCAFLTHALGFIPLNKEWNIGCTTRKTSNIVPKCKPGSIAIYENFEVDGSGLVSYNGGPPYKIISYDNSPCLTATVYNSCGISKLCKNVFGNKLFQSPMPVTAYIMGCLKETGDNLFYGCSGTNNSIDNRGMLSVIQERLRPIVFLTILLSIIIFAMKIIFSDSQIKTSDITILMMKIAAVIYFTNQTGAGANKHNGMEIYSNFINKISTSLQAIVLKSSSDLENGGNGLCNYDDSHYDEVSGGKTNKGKYLYLKPWDILDCRVVYYLTTSLSKLPFHLNIFEHIAGFINFDPAHIILVLGLIFFTIFLIFWVMEIFEIIFITGILFSLLILLSPIFVPLILFPATKKMFDQWVTKIITFSLYPVMIFAFMSFCFLMIDHLSFGNTKFIQASQKEFIMGRKVDYFVIDTSTDYSSEAQCAGFDPGIIPKGCDCNGANCLMSLVQIKDKKTKTFLGTAIGAEVNAGSIKNDLILQKSVLSLLFLLFILYHLTKRIYKLLDVLSGSSLTLDQVNQARSPHSRMEGLVSKLGAFSYNKKKGKDDDKEDEKGSVKRSSSIRASFDQDAGDMGSGSGPIRGSKASGDFSASLDRKAVARDNENSLRGNTGSDNIRDANANNNPDERSSNYEEDNLRPSSELSSSGLNSDNSETSNNIFNGGTESTSNGTGILDTFKQDSRFKDDNKKTLVNNSSVYFSDDKNVESSYLLSDSVGDSEDDSEDGNTKSKQAKNNKELIRRGSTISGNNEN